MTISDFASLILAVSGSLSLLYIARQVAITRQQTKGQFLLSLDDLFGKSREIFLKLNANPQFIPQGVEWAQVWALMSVFERIAIMVEGKILDIAIVERLHGYILMNLLANDAIYQRLLATGAEWKDFIDLCQAVAKHHRRSGSGPHIAPFLERVKSLDKEARTIQDPWKF
jgi:hypothetical protein